MAWTAPMTAVANATWTAAQFNTHVRDNFLETEVNKVSAAGQYVIGNGTNSVTNRIAATNAVATSQTTTSTTFVDLATTGPAVTVTSGTSALVAISAFMSNTSGSATTVMAYAVSGATTVAAADSMGFSLTNNVAGQGGKWSHVFLHTGLTAGSNTFTAKYRVNGGTGSFSIRRLTVLPF